MQNTLDSAIPLTEAGKAPISHLYPLSDYMSFNTLTRVAGHVPVAITIWKGDKLAVGYVPDSQSFFRAFPRACNWAVWHAEQDIWHVHVSRSQAHCRQAVAAALLISQGKAPRVWNELGKKWLGWVLRCWGASREMMAAVEAAPCQLVGRDVSLEHHDVKLAPGLDPEWLEQLARE